MSTTLRGRGTSYDNIAVGSAFGTERTIAGAAPPAEVNGAGSNIVVGSAHPTGNASDDYVVAVATPLRDNVKVGG